MASTVTIESISYDLNIQTLDIISKPNLIEKNLIPDPMMLTENSSIMISVNRDRKNFNITGYCDNDTRLVIKGAYKLGQKVYPTLYQPLGSANLTASSYYYITQFNTSYKLGSDTVWYDMVLIYGGSIYKT